MTLQRYVSKELTHFVGRDKPEEEQYSILEEGILKGGWLKHYPNNPKPAEWLPETSTVHGKSPGAPVDEMFQAYVVCFCDIPVTDLEIHMRKYSRFGLSFLKHFLIQKGANPVFYVARNSGARVPGMPAEFTPAFGYGRPREAVFEKFLKDYLAFEQQFMAEPGDPSGDWTEEQHIMYHLQFFLEQQIFGFTKYFDDATSDEDPANVYMEREWRVLGDVNFDLKDVYRVFLPSAYAERFRSDVPGYAGQVTFVDDSS